jgi:hypothetical protein
VYVVIGDVCVVVVVVVDVCVVDVDVVDDVGVCVVLQQFHFQIKTV